MEENDKMMMLLVAVNISGGAMARAYMLLLELAPEEKITLDLKLALEHVNVVIKEIAFSKGKPTF